MIERTIIKINDLILLINDQKGNFKNDIDKKIIKKLEDVKTPLERLLYGKKAK